jgi:hypothetical protein
MTTDNLRREARIETELPVVLYRGKTPISLVTTDVSYKGLFLRTPDPPPLRSLVRMHVTLPARAIRAHAMVVHVQKTDAIGVGLQFWGLAGPERTAWDDYVRALIDQRRALVKAKPAQLEVPTPSGVRIVGKRLKEPMGNR